MKLKILITIQSFEPKFLATQQIYFTKQETGLPVGLNNGSLSKKMNQFHTSKMGSVALPKTRTLYTVLRSPHIDKKSREQFEILVWKQLVVINTEIRHLQEKLSHLKFHEVSGVQMKVRFQTKTRLHFLKG